MKFNKKKHTYNINKKELISVTTIIHNHLFEPFNAREIARKLSKFPQNKEKKQGVRYFLNKWKASQEDGSLVHKEIENYIKGNTPYVFNSKSKQAVAYLGKLRELYPESKWVSEWVVWSERIGVAGTIDLVLIHPDDSITIIDWKTNEKLSTSGYNGKKGIHEYTKDLEDCDLNRYAMQLSMYAYLLELGGIKIIREVMVVHLKGADYSEVTLPYMKDRIKKIFRRGWKHEKTK